MIYFKFSLIKIRDHEIDLLAAWPRRCRKHVTLVLNRTFLSMLSVFAWHSYLIASINC